MSLAMNEGLDICELSTEAMGLSGEGVIITDAKANIVAVNPAMCEMTGFRADQLIGQTPRLFKSGYHDDNFYDEMWNNLNQIGLWQGEIMDRKADGEVTARHLRIKAVHNSAGDTTHFIGLMQDSSVLATMTELANKDPLTGLANRRLLSERMQQAAARAKRTGKSFGLLFIDLDAFKQINDTYGHIAGDQVLLEVAERLQSQLREEDTVARIGGDEFIVLLPDVANQENIDKVINKLTVAVNRPCYHNGHRLIINCSIGGSLYPDQGEDMEKLIAIADKNMFVRKNREYVN